MGQYTVAQFLYENGPSTKVQIAASTGDSQASVAQSLTELRKKGLVRQRDGNRWEFHPEADEDQLEAIRPTPLSETLDKS